MRRLYGVLLWLSQARSSFQACVVYFHASQGFFCNRNYSRNEIVIGTLQLQRSKLDAVLACYGVDTHTYALWGGHTRTVAGQIAGQKAYAGSMSHAPL